MTAILQFEAARPKLLGIAYRLLGSASDAEDAVQDCWLRWQSAAHGDIRTPEAWLVTTVTRLCLDFMKSARVQREQYVGPWLPEPVVQMEDDAAVTVELAESMSYALMILLEELSPKERAVYVLREAFDFKHEEIADLVGVEAGNSRKLLGRAKNRLKGQAERSTAPTSEHQQILLSFVEASATGDVDKLLSVLSPDVSLISDGGGKVLAALRPLHGKERIQRFFARLAKQLNAGYLFEIKMVNTLPGLLVSLDGKPYACVSFVCNDGCVEKIYIVRNPEKLNFESQAAMH